MSDREIDVGPPLTVDPEREGNFHEKTGIYIRAVLDRKWGAFDIAYANGWADPADPWTCGQCGTKLTRGQNAIQRRQMRREFKRYSPPGTVWIDERAGLAEDDWRRLIAYMNSRAGTCPGCDSPAEPLPTPNTPSKPHLG